MKKMINRLLLPIQYLLVFIFIVFEELVWEGIAVPVGKYLQSLRILQRLERVIAGTNRYLILVIFVLLFGGVELAGVTAGVLMVQGMVLPGVLLYGVKIPIAAFTFWLFRVSREKLMTFDWFRRSYEKLLLFLEWIKSRKVYRNSLALAYRLKFRMKKILSELKTLFFPQEKGENFGSRLKALYRRIKASLRRNRLQ